MIWDAALCLSALLASQTVSAASRTQERPFPDTPTNHWAYEGQGYLKSRGLLVGYPDGLGSRPFNESRYTFAVMYHAAALNLSSLSSGLEQLREQIAIDTPGSARATQDLQEFGEWRAMLDDTLMPRACDYLERGLKEFAPELRELGASRDSTYAVVARYRSIMSRLGRPKVGSALKQFPDVPTGHWAAKAVLDLRRLGLIQGYPDGEFEGTPPSIPATPQG